MEGPYIVDSSLELDSEDSEEDWVDCEEDGDDSLSLKVISEDQ